MLSDAAKTALIDIRFNIFLANAFVEGFDFDAFRNDLKTFYAATRALESYRKPAVVCRTISRGATRGLNGALCEMPATTTGTIMTTWRRTSCG